jgi:hypothetical protein
MRFYVLIFAGFIAAFGAFPWRLPANSRYYERIGGGDQRDDASAPDPDYRPHVSLPRPTP